MQGRFHVLKIMEPAPIDSSYVSYGTCTKLELGTAHSHAKHLVKSIREIFYDVLKMTK